MQGNLYKFVTYFIIIISLVACGNGSSTASSSGSQVIFAPFHCPGTTYVSFPGVSGIRQIGDSESVYVTGVYVQGESNYAFLYKGLINGNGTCSIFSYPSSSGATVTATSLYGPDYSGGDDVTVVGSYTTAESGNLVQHGLLYQGANDGSTISGYSTIDPSILESHAPVTNTIAHSTMGGMVVGDYSTPIISGHAFIYDIQNNKYYRLAIPDQSDGTTSAYGIWYNGGTSYTIAGGYSVVPYGTDAGFITDWDSETQQISHFTTLNYNNLPESEVGTNFEGITTDGNGGYNLAADWQYNPSAQLMPAFVHVPRNSDGSFGTAQWTNLGYYPSATTTSANTVYRNYVLGLYQIESPTPQYGYVALVR